MAKLRKGLFGEWLHATNMEEQYEKRDDSFREMISDSFACILACIGAKRMRRIIDILSLGDGTELSVGAWIGWGLSITLPYESDPTLNSMPRPVLSAGNRDRLATTYMLAAVTGRQTLVTFYYHDADDYLQCVSPFGKRGSKWTHDAIISCFRAMRSNGAGHALGVMEKAEQTGDLCPLLSMAIGHMPSVWVATADLEGLKGDPVGFGEALAESLRDILSDGCGPEEALTFGRFESYRTILDAEREDDRLIPACVSGVASIDAIFGSDETGYAALESAAMSLAHRAEPPDWGILSEWLIDGYFTTNTERRSVRMAIESYGDAGRYDAVLAILHLTDAILSAVGCNPASPHRRDGKRGNPLDEGLELSRSGIEQSERMIIEDGMPLDMIVQTMLTSGDAVSDDGGGSIVLCS